MSDSHNKGSQLTTWQTLMVNDYLESPSGGFRAYMQQDGNLVVYQKNFEYLQWVIFSNFLWSSNDNGGLPKGNGNYYAIIQSDGNFCIYLGEPSQHGIPLIWNSKKLADGGTFLVRLQDDGNLVVCKGADGSGGIIWNTDTKFVKQGVKGIRLNNKAGFVFSFHITTDQGTLQGQSGTISAGFSKTLDCIPEQGGKVVYPEARIWSLDLFSDPPDGTYLARSNQTCICDVNSNLYGVYDVTGVTLGHSDHFELTGFST